MEVIEAQALVLGCSESQSHRSSLCVSQQQQMQKTILMPASRTSLAKIPLSLSNRRTVLDCASVHQHTRREEIVDKAHFRMAASPACIGRKMKRMTGWEHGWQPRHIPEELIPPRAVLLDKMTSYLSRRMGWACECRLQARSREMPYHQRIKPMKRKAWKEK